MMSSPSPANEQASPCETSAQGKNASCQGLGISIRSNRGSEPSFNEKRTGLTQFSQTALPATTSGSPLNRPEPHSPVKQHSPLGKSAVPGQSADSDDQDESFSSRSAAWCTPDALRKRQGRMSLTGDKIIEERSGYAQERPGTWYARHNSAGPDRHTESQHLAPDATPSKPRPSSLVTVTPAPAASNAGRPNVKSPASIPRFSFFNMKVLKGFATGPVSPVKDDELVNLDIYSALFPKGPPKDGEPFSPAAFKNLEMSAVGLLRRFQSEYQDKAAACQELRAERDAQQDERLENETRIAHLKLQLEDMAQRAAETEATMRGLMEELKREKKLKREVKMARANGVITSSGTSSISEDLCAEDDQREKQRRRRSGGTTKSDSASGDTDDESVDELSLFSRPRSPTLAVSINCSDPIEGSTREGATNTHPFPQISKCAVTLEPPRVARQSEPPMSAFQKLVRGISGETAYLRAGHGCESCQGQDASIAWDTASLLRDENRGLKRRVGELETAVEEALDAVMGFNL